MFAVPEDHTAADRGVVALPNLLDAYWRGYGPLCGRPLLRGDGARGRAKSLGLIQHEAMHPILNPLVDAHLVVAGSGPSRPALRRAQAAVSAGYRTWPNILHESVIRAIEVRLAAAKDRERIIRQEEAAGFPLVRPLAGRLAEYEASGQPMAEFMPRRPERVERWGVVALIHTPGAMLSPRDPMARSDLPAIIFALFALAGMGGSARNLASPRSVLASESARFGGCDIIHVCLRQF